jgi:hypothetical protein
MQKLVAEQKRRASALRKRDETNRLKVEKAKKLMLYILIQV